MNDCDQITRALMGLCFPSGFFFLGLMVYCLITGKKIHLVPASNPPKDPT